MKQEKGVTLLVLVIYLIAISIVMSILAVISENFFYNSNYITDTSRYIAEYNKFNMYFIEDVKSNKSLISLSDTEIVFADGTTYTYQTSPDNGIYRNKVKICSHILYCKFKQTTETDEESGIEKCIVSVSLILQGSKNYVATNHYVLKYW